MTRKLRRKGNNGMVKLQINDIHGTTITVEVEYEVIQIEDYIDRLIVPALLGLGFSDELLQQYIQSNAL